ncbi:MAG TPA: serine/threonine-protein kinase [Pyrinomonadaceae bacterium]|nr:serine/threonine-protein kinase [Pyrinomonadaceae bacterium]
MTDLQRLRRADEIVQAALDGKAVELSVLLDAECAGDALLRAEVESLLGYRERAKDFIETPAFALGAGLFADGSDGDCAPAAGRRVGAYKIVREIGRGGMGAVFLAERADGEFRQQVAVKVIRQTLAGSETRRHFKRERQILASLNHPNIARLLDGGVSTDGEPFLAMEYVEGVRIDVYADTHRLSTGARLGLFRQVCAAVQYAHQNLVIHRDLKPSNILVTAEGVPKLLDFGIAKLLDPESEDAGAHTVTELGVMTPEYASPEQVQGLQVTTASDVYSLGVILYELLAGHRPYRVKSRKPDEIARAICEQEPERPSAAIRRTGDSPKADGGPTTITPETVGRARSEQPERLRRRLAGDLDNIVLMAMRKEPARRYASVAQLSEDIRRHTDGLPVIARKDTFKYRGAKFIKRNRVGVAAAALVVLTLVGGIVGVAWQARAATEQARVAAQERDRARVEAAKAERINEFLQSIFASADPSWYSSGYGQRGEVKVVDVLEQAGRRVDAELKDEPEIRAELHHTIGTTYMSLGRNEQARAHLGAAVDAYRGLYGERHPKVAEALYYLGASMQVSGDNNSARALYQQSLEVFRAVDPNNVNVPYILVDLASSLKDAGEAAEAERAVHEGLGLARQRYGEEHVLSASLLVILGSIHEIRGDVGRAETSYQTALATFKRLPNGGIQSSDALGHLGHLSTLRGDFGRAEAQLREALDTSGRTQNETHPRHIGLLLQLAEIHYRRGAYADAEREAASALDLLRRIAFHNSGNQLRGLSLLSLINAKTRRPDRAAAFLREALTLFDNIPGEDEYHDHGLLSEALVEMKRVAEARSLLLKSYTHHARTFGEQNPEALRTRQRLEQLDAPPRTP